MGANISWLFNKDYFKDIDYENLDNENNKEIIEEKVQKVIEAKIDKQEDEPLGNIHFKATTTYPGLLLGSGNAHELSSVKGQAILGFDFDYTTGVPIIRGSSIKGVLRSAFKHSQYLQELLGDNNINIKDLETEIFDNNDIFFDATIISSGKVLADDYLAPHGDDPLKNPIPLRFIKVVPNITFRFDFELSDGIISKETKSKLFQSILEDLGLGAKTNVGYGKFEGFKKEQTPQEIEQQKVLEQKQKEEAEQKRLQEIEKAKKQKEQKAQGISNLKTCKDIKSAMKLINESLGKKASPTPEQKTFIEQFWKKYGKKASKSEIKFFKKFISV
jgi:CRISPR-associated protein Cmr6